MQLILKMAQLRIYNFEVESALFKSEIYMLAEIGGKQLSVSFPKMKTIGQVITNLHAKTCLVLSCRPTDSRGRHGTDIYVRYLKWALFLGT